PIITDTPGIAAIYAPGGAMIKSGETLYFHQLADTLEALGQQGPALFYTGAVAQAILADQQAHGGLLTETDLAGYRVLRSQPLAINYHDYTVLLPTASSVGGPLIAFALKLLASCPVADVAHNQFQHLSMLAEIMRLTNIARAAWEAEPDPARLNGHGFKSAASLLADDNLAGYRPKLIEALAGRGVLVEPNAAGGPSNTTHISVADQNGMMVSVTTSAGESAGFVVGDTGVILNNMLGEIDLHPGGFHQLPPGHRLQTMMTPTLVLHQGQPVLALGSGGSNRIRTAILQTISNVIDFKLDLVAAVTASRVHFEAGEMQLEGGIDPQVADQLEAAGYQVNRWTVRNMFFGGAHAVARREGDTQARLPWVAVGDERRGGSVAVIKPLQG
ncbi:MAG: gamma-glutamyltransferase, partial [Anaerolineae bacterium]|nr:gamma-glutamyltransferase [Anaerolineae bacterium]